MTVEPRWVWREGSIFEDGEPRGSMSREHAERILPILEAHPAVLRTLDPEGLEAIANEIPGWEHSGRVHSLRVLARQQRGVLVALARPAGVQG